MCKPMPLCRVQTTLRSRSSPAVIVEPPDDPSTNAYVYLITLRHRLEQKRSIVFIVLPRLPEQLTDSSHRERNPFRWLEDHAVPSC